jgi:hypothetical protein
MRRLVAAISRFLDAILPRVPSDDDFAATEAEAAERRRRLRFRRFQKDGRGGNR